MLVKPFCLYHQLVREIRLMLYFFTQEKCAHHRNISEGKNKSTQQSKGNCLCHWFKHFPFNALQCKYGQVNNQDNDLSKYRAVHHFAGRMIYFFIHLSLLINLSIPANFLLCVKLVHHCFYNNHGTIHNQTKIQCTQTHQVAAYTKHIHHDNSKQHG